MHTCVSLSHKVILDCDEYYNVYVLVFASAITTQPTYYVYSTTVTSIIVVIYHNKEIKIFGKELMAIIYKL